MTYVHDGETARFEFGCDTSGDVAISQGTGARVVVGWKDIHALVAKRKALADAEMAEWAETPDGKAVWAAVFAAHKEGLADQ